MKLAALGLVTAGLGIVYSAPGLIGVGAFWIVMGLVARQHGLRLKEIQEQTPQGAKPVIDRRTFAIGTAIWFGLGIPSLLVGLLELGIPSEDEAWKWLPIVIGGLALGIGALSGLMYVAGSAVVAATGETPTIPAAIRIRSVKETGMYVNEKPRLEFELTVEPDAGSGVAAYDVVKKATVPYTAMGSIRPGDGFTALVAGPDDPTSMEIYWDQPVLGAQSPTNTGEDVSDRLDELEQLKAEGKVTEEEYQTLRQRILDSL